MQAWIIEALQDVHHPDYNEACISLAELCAEADYEVPGSSSAIYERLYQEYGIEM